MSELREKIAQLMDEFGESYDQDCTFCNEQWADEATDRIIALVREALLSYDAVYTLEQVVYSESSVSNLENARAMIEQVLAAAGLGGQGDDS